MSTTGDHLLNLKILPLQCLLHSSPLSHSIPDLSYAKLGLISSRAVVLDQPSDLCSHFIHTPQAPSPAAGCTRITGLLSNLQHRRATTPVNSSQHSPQLCLDLSFWSYSPTSHLPGAPPMVECTLYPGHILRFSTLMHLQACNPSHPSCPAETASTQSPVDSCKLTESLGSSTQQLLVGACLNLPWNAVPGIQSSSHPWRG